MWSKWVAAILQPPNNNSGKADTVEKGERIPSTTTTLNAKHSHMESRINGIRFIGFIRQQYLWKLFDCSAAFSRANGRGIGAFNVRPSLAVKSW